MRPDVDDAGRNDDAPRALQDALDVLRQTLVLDRRETRWSRSPGPRARLKHRGRQLRSPLRSGPLQTPIEPRCMSVKDRRLRRRQAPRRDAKRICGCTKLTSVTATAALERGRKAFQQQAWAEAHAQLAAADGETPLGAEDLLQLALSSMLTGHDSETIATLTRAHEQFLASGAIARGPVRDLAWVRSAKRSRAGTRRRVALARAAPAGRG